MSSAVSDDVSEQLVTACRTGLGDELRSVTYLGPQNVEHLYTREDLEPAVDALQFVESERAGIASEQGYGWSDLGAFEFAIRAFEEGYVGRVVVGEHGVYVTTDALTIEGFGEISKTIRELLADI
jgi:hypothetical protein